VKNGKGLRACEQDRNLRSGGFLSEVKERSTEGRTSLILDLRTKRESVRDLQDNLAEPGPMNMERSEYWGTLDPGKPGAEAGQKALKVKSGARADRHGIKAVNQAQAPRIEQVGGREVRCLFRCGVVIQRGSALQKKEEGGPLEKVGGLGTARPLEPGLRWGNHTAYLGPINSWENIRGTD